MIMHVAVVAIIDICAIISIMDMHRNTKSSTPTMAATIAIIGKFRINFCIGIGINIHIRHRDLLRISAIMIISGGINIGINISFGISITSTVRRHRAR
jgi:hypothetical protein